MNIKKNLAKFALYNVATVLLFGFVWSHSESSNPDLLGYLMAAYVASFSLVIIFYVTTKLLEVINE